MAWLPILRIGQAAYNLLIPGARGRVLAALSNVAYLCTTHDEVFWLLTEEAPMHRRGLQLAGPLPTLVIDCPFTLKDQRLAVGSDLVLDFSRASKWEPKRPIPEDAVPVTDLSKRISTVFSLFADLPSPAGFGILIPEILRIAQDHALLCSTPRLPSAPGFAWPAIQEIAKACLARDIPRTLEHAEDLIGLGEGLTPSGDDFIGGLLFSIRILQDTYALFHEFRFPDQAPFLESLKPRTHIISYTMLRDHAAGHASESLHQFANSLLTGQDLESTYRLGMRLTQIGHSTGWDLLAGVLTGMLLTYGSGTRSTLRVCSSTTHQSYQGKNSWISS